MYKYEFIKQNIKLLSASVIYFHLKNLISKSKSMVVFVGLVLVVFRYKQVLF